jgi:uncharacterized protein (TIGR03086 family)
MESFVALDRARAEAERRLDAVGPDQWNLSTPCTDWTVFDIARHLVVGNKMAALLVTGAGRDDTLAHLKAWHQADGALEPAALIAAFRTSADEQAEALRQPGVLELTVHHPVGDIPGAQLLRFRVGDMTLHAWDLARAIGADERLDPELADDVYTSMLPMAPFIGTLGMFGSGPSGDVDEGAAVQARLLDLSGRRS